MFFLPLLIPTFILQKLDVARKLLQKSDGNRICCQVHLRRYAGVGDGASENHSLQTGNVNLNAFGSGMEKEVGINDCQ